MKRRFRSIGGVLSQCRRVGSLDAAIDGESVVANDIVGLVSRCVQIRTVCFNGQAAAPRRVERDVRLHEGDTMMIPGGARHNETKTSDAFELLEVSVPADMVTVACEAPA